MSNNRNNPEQNEKVELTPQQQDPGSAKPSDFSVAGPSDELDVPFHKQHGGNLREYHELLREGLMDPGKSKPRSIPDRNVVPAK